MSNKMADYLLKEPVEGPFSPSTEDLCGLKYFVEAALLSQDYESIPKILTDAADIIKDFGGQLIPPETAELVAFFASVPALVPPSVLQASPVSPRALPAAIGQSQDERPLPYTYSAARNRLKATSRLVIYMIESGVLIQENRGISSSSLDMLLGRMSGKSFVDSLIHELAANTIGFSVKSLDASLSYYASQLVSSGLVGILPYTENILVYNTEKKKELADFFLTNRKPPEQSVQKRMLSGPLNGADGSSY